MCIGTNNFAIGITVSVWTVIQSGFHLVWAACGYYFYTCKIHPSYYWLVLVYLTYFYNHKCGVIEIEGDEYYMTRGGKKVQRPNSSQAETQDLYEIVQTILEKASLPEEASAASRAHVYFDIFIVADFVWIVTACLLLAGICCQIKKCLSLLFYCPWLIATACISILDVVAAVHFGLDMIQIYNFTTWLKFIGVANYNDFKAYNANSISSWAPVSSSTSMCLLFSRLLVVWLLNIVQFFQVMNIAALAYQDGVPGAGTGRRPLTVARKRVDPDTSASRIRSWQLFYGAIESTSSIASSSEEKGRDCNSNRPKGGPQHARKAPLEAGPEPEAAARLERRQSLDSQGEGISSVKDESLNMSTYYHACSDVAEGILDDSKDKTFSVTGLRGQLPWSYTRSQELGPRRPSAEGKRNAYRAAEEGLGSGGGREVSTAL